MPQVAQSDTAKNIPSRRRMHAERSTGCGGAGKSASSHSIPQTIAKTAAKESWNETEKSAGGWTVRMARAAAARLFLRSVSRSIRKAARKTATMMNARCVDGENPATSAYPSAGPSVSSAAPLRVHARRRHPGHRRRARWKIAKADVATSEMCSPEMASMWLVPVRVKAWRMSAGTPEASPITSAFSTAPSGPSPARSITRAMSLRTRSTAASSPRSARFSRTTTPAASTKALHQISW